MRKKLIFMVFIIFFAIFLKCTSSNAVEIPKVYFEGDISNMTSKKDERKIKIKYTSNDVNFEKFAKIKVQGSSSLVYDKKNYTINLYEDDSFNKKSKVDVGHEWGEQSKYNLKANWIDKTHSRNVVSAKIAGKVQKKYNVLDELPNNGSIDGFPVEVYINNDFLGLYTWNIPKDAWMWKVDETDENQIVLEGGWYTEYVNLKKTLDGFDGTGWEIEVGEPNKETVQNFNRLVKFINESTDEEFINNIDSYINKDAILNYIEMVYLIQGIDNTGKNMMLLTYDNGRTWYPCLYDLDSTWGTWTDGKKATSYKILPEDDIADHSTNNLIVRIIKCFPDEITNRWFNLRNDIFSKENILMEFNDFKNSIPEETLRKEQVKWQNIPGYGYDQIEEFIDERLSYIDEIMNNRRTINLEGVKFLINNVAVFGKAFIDMILQKIIII